MINTFLLQAAVAVGVTALSSEDMYMAARRGKCVEIFHVIGDTLCQLGKPPVKPDLGPPNSDSSANTSEDTESNIQQMIVNQTETLPTKLDQLDIDDDTSDVAKNENVSEVAIRS